MVQLAELDAERQSLDATLSYFVDTKATPITLVAEPGQSDRRTGGGASEEHRVKIRNGRLYDNDYAVDNNGFSFAHPDTRVADFYDEDEIRRVYYPEMEALIKAEAGARRVVVFDHTLRTADQTLREAAKIRDPVRRVHNDYTEWSGPRRVRDLMGDEAEELLRGRFAIIQVWRPIRHPVETWPLAICDAQSLDEHDLVVTERRYQNRTGQTYAIHYNPNQYWYWFPRMRRDEALVFKVYESMRDGRARWTAHTAFDDPTAPPQARARESIEIRTLAFF
ncbi:MAG: CmcJ/NvfI family oxidoreductase [Stellaceae bacterium]